MHIELTKDRGVCVNPGLVTSLTHHAQIAGAPGPRKLRRVRRSPTSDDLVQRKFEQSLLSEL